MHTIVSCSSCKVSYTRTGDHCFGRGAALVYAGAPHVHSLNNGSFPTRFRHRRREWSSPLACPYYDCIILLYGHVFLLSVMFSCLDCIVSAPPDSLQINT